MCISIIVKLQCQRAIILEPQSVIVTCTSERDLISVLCSINNGPFQNCKLMKSSTKDVLPTFTYTCRFFSLDG